MAVAASVAGSHVSPQVRSNPKATASVRCLCNVPRAEMVRLRAKPLRASRASFFEVSPRSRGKDEPRQGQRPATAIDFGRTREAARSKVSHRWLAICEPSRAQARDCPGYHTTRQGVSVAGRVRDCVVRARVSIVKTDSRDALPTGRRRPSSKLRQRTASSAADRRREAAKGPLPKVKSASGPRGTGSQARSLVVPPVRHHGPGATNAVRGCSQHPSLRPVHQPPLDEGGASSRARPSDPCSPGSANQRAARCSDCRPALPHVGTDLRVLSMVAWVLHDRRGNTFGFVVCRNSIQGAMALQRQVSNHRQQPLVVSRSTERSAGSTGGGESRARSGRCQPARRTTGRRAFLDASNRGQGSIEVVW